MQLNPEKLKKLKEIIQKDYGVFDFTDEELNQLGFLLLRITKLAMNAFDRSEKKQLQTLNKQLAIIN